MRLTIGIKALNEERRIAACIESALTVTQKYDGEVILACLLYTSNLALESEGLPCLQSSSPVI